MLWKTLLCLLGTVSCVAAADVGELTLYPQVAGEIRRVTVAAGDTLVGLSAHLGVPWRTLALTNDIEDPNRIYPGQVLEVDTRRIVPVEVSDGLVLNIPETTLYRFEGRALTARYPVGLGRPLRPTPLGSFTVLVKDVEPQRTLAASPREESLYEGRLVDSKALPGDAMALGPRWIQLSIWGYGIHATPFASSVGQFLNRGSISMTEAGLEDLFGRVQPGTPVEIVYLPVKLAATPKGEIWVEAHPDPYRLGSPGVEQVLAFLEGEGLGERVDAELLGEILERRLGVAARIGTVVRQQPGADNGGNSAGATDQVSWSCLDCPPGPSRRVTFHLQAHVPVDLPNPFPLEILDDAGQVVFRPQMVAQTLVHLEPGENRNFVWEVRDTEGQPLPPGSYSAVIRFFVDGGAQRQQRTIPIWVGK